MVVPFYRLVDFPHCPSWPAGTLLVHFEVLVSEGMGAREKRDDVARWIARDQSRSKRITQHLCIESASSVAGTGSGRWEF